MCWGIQNTSSSSAAAPVLCWLKLFQLFLPVTRKEGSGGWERGESNWMSSTVDDASSLPIQFSEFSVWCNRFRNVVCNVGLFFWCHVCYPRATVRGVITGVFHVYWILIIHMTCFWHSTSSCGTAYLYIYITGMCSYAQHKSTASIFRGQIISSACQIKHHNYYCSYLTLGI